MSNVKIDRDCDGILYLRVAGHYASGAKVTGFNTFEGEMCAIVLVPLKHAVLGEVDTVVPFVRPIIETR